MQNNFLEFLDNFSNLDKLNSNLNALMMGHEKDIATHTGGLGSLSMILHKALQKSTTDTLLFSNQQPTAKLKKMVEKEAVKELAKNFEKIINENAAVASTSIQRVQRISQKLVEENFIPLLETGNTLSKLIIK